MESGMSGAISHPNKVSTSRAVRQKMAEVRRELKQLQKELLELVKEEEKKFDKIQVFLHADNDGAEIQIHGQNPKYRYTRNIGGWLELKSKG